MLSSESITNLAAAVSGMIGKTGTIPKDRTHKQGWKYTSDAALLRHLGPMMHDHGLALIPVEQSYELLPYGGKGQVVATVCTWRLTHTSGEWMQVQTLGEGYDSLDKALYKAQTGALKYAMRMLFAVPTGDDPDATEEPSPTRPPPLCTPQEEARRHKVLDELLGDYQLGADFHEKELNKGSIYRLSARQFDDYCEWLKNGGGTQAAQKWARTFELGG